MENKKVIIIYILKLFEDIIDENLPTTQTSIANVLGKLGIECDKKTVGRNIKYLIQIGCPIKKNNRGGYYYDRKEPWDLWSINKTKCLKKILSISKRKHFEDFN